MDDSLWPWNPRSVVPDKQIDWLDVPGKVLGKTRLDVFRKCNKSDLINLRDNYPTKWEDVPEPDRIALSTYMDSSQAIDMGDTDFTLAKVMSIADRSLQIESIRASIPAESIIKALLDAAKSGQMGDCTLDGKTRADILMKLLNKTLPDSKSVELDERGGKADRRRRTLNDVTKGELDKMTEEELRNLINQAKEEL